jgi:hypothetical protein
MACRQTGSRLSRCGGRLIMATVGQSGALRRVTVHYASSPTRGAVVEVSLDDLDDELLQFVLADLLPGQVRAPSSPSARACMRTHVWRLPAMPALYLCTYIHLCFFHEHAADHFLLLPSSTILESRISSLH